MMYYRTGVLAMASFLLFYTGMATAGDEYRDKISKGVQNNQSVLNKSFNSSYTEVRIDSEMGRIRKEMDKNIDDETRQELEDELSRLSASSSSEDGNVYVEDSVIVPPGANVYGDIYNIHD